MITINHQPDDVRHLRVFSSLACTGKGTGLGRRAAAISPIDASTPTATNILFSFDGR